MEKKKNKSADEYKRRPLYLMLGLVASLSVSLMAFEWKSYDIYEGKDLGNLTEEFEDWMDVPPTVMPEPKLPIIQQPKIIEIPDEEDIEAIIDLIIDVDLSDDTVIEDFSPTDELPVEEAASTFLVIEKEASFPGGNKGWGKFLNRHFKYPRQAKRMGIEGRVFLQFDVAASGEISNIEVVRGIGGGCDEEAIRVLNKSHKWEPGEQRGVPVKTKHRMSIMFRLK